MVSVVEDFLFKMMSGYDEHIYTPLQRNLSPIVKKIPRYTKLNNKDIPIFTANIVTLARTFLIFPIAWLLKFDQCFLAALMVVFHDFLDHLDGIVAKVHKTTYPNLDDPLLGGFLDAFCDKIVNVFSLWSIIQMTPVDNFNYFKLIYIIICYSVIGYETVIGIVRVEDYYEAKFNRNSSDENSSSSISNSNAVTQASMEGKLKEKLESMGVAFLCLGLSKSIFDGLNLLNNLFGLICFILTLRMAHKSLMKKLKAREIKNKT